MRAQVLPEYEPTVPALLHRNAERWPDADAVVTPDGRLTHAELEATSRDVAASLIAAGVGKGSHVGVLFPNSTAWVTAWAAAARIGAVVVPVNTFYKPAELAKFLRHSDISVIAGVDHFLQHDYVAALESIAPELSEARSPLRLPSLPQLRRVILQQTTSPWADQLTPAPDCLPLIDGMEEAVTPSDPMLITYTSGSTGEPKGIVHSQGTVIRHARNLAALSGLDEHSRTWTPMPLCWVGGFAFSLLRAITVGGTFLTQDVFEPGAALQLIQKEQVTNVAGWPAVSKALREHPDFATTDVSSVTRGSFWDALPADRRPPDQSRVIGSLGMSETCGPHTFWTADEEPLGTPEGYERAFGREVPGSEHRIIDPATGAELPPGEEGEVLVRGYNLMLGMHRRERADVFDADGWYHTGDRGLFRDGWFFFTGRQSDLIKTSGANVAPSEVEARLLACDGVKLAFVLGVPHPDRGEDVVALVVPWAGASLDPPALQAALKADLSSYKVPRRIAVIGDADVPYMTSQKPDRRALTALAASLTN